MSIQEILEAHTQSIRNGRCSCEDRGPKRTELEHRAHVAEVLDKYMQERESKTIEAWQQEIVISRAEAWEEGWEDGRESVHNSQGKFDTNPYKEEK